MAEKIMAIMNKEEVEELLRKAEVPERKFKVYYEKKDHDDLFIMIMPEEETRKIEAQFEPQPEPEVKHIQQWVLSDADEYDEESQEKLLKFAEAIEYGDLRSDIVTISGRELEADMKKLKPANQLVLNSRFELYGNEKLTFSELGKELGITASCARDKNNWSCRKLRESYWERRKEEKRQKVMEQIQAGSRLDGVFPLDEIGIMPRASRALYHNGYVYANDIEDVPQEEIFQMLIQGRNIGEKTAREAVATIQEFLKNHSK